MAGIVGIFLKHKTQPEQLYKQAFHRMMQKLAYNQFQLFNTHFSDRVWFGNVIPIAQNANDNFHYTIGEGIYVIIDGMVFVNENERKLVQKHYGINECISDHQLIPFLFKHYNDSIVHHITGWFNIFVLEEKTHNCLLFNDRLGYLPLYYFENDTILIFASKIESLLASRLLDKIEIDAVTMAEHLFFKYPLSDHTYIKSIKTLPDASLLQFNGNESEIKHYWDVSEFFGSSPLNKKQSIAAINEGLKGAINKLFSRVGSSVNFSLTGGWDSRVVLSYLLPEYKHLLNAYSFGAPGVDDLEVPSLIADKENIKYTPFLLDQCYLDHHFLTDAADTIILSNGTRNYKRTHYVHAIKQIAEVSPFLITGIFGDEAFKVGKPQGGEVISKNTLNFIETGFDVSKTLEQFKASNILKIFVIPEDEILESFENRLNILSKRYKQYKTSGEQYFAFRFSLNLRKYFGNEANSYNDFVYCHSPFIDYDFLKVFASTKYMGSRFDFRTPSMKLKAQSSWLYYQIIQRNHSNLSKYPSSRGFSMRDTNTLAGLIIIIINKFFKRHSRKRIDGFNTKATDQLFRNLINLEPHCKIASIFAKEENIKPFSNWEDAQSLIFWSIIINRKYNP